MNPATQPMVAVRSATVPEQEEWKYLLDAASARRFWHQASAELEPQHRDPRRPIAYHRTTYYDTPDQAYLRSTGERRSRRLRVREYASAVDEVELPVLAEVCFLELKQSSDGLRSKRRFALAANEVDEHIARLSDAPLSPCLTTWYRRSSLSDWGERVRVTLDERLAFCRPAEVGSPISSLAPDSTFARTRALVLEVKLWIRPPAWLERALRGFSPAIGFSKFRAGRLALVAPFHRAAPRVVDPCGKIARGPSDPCGPNSVEDEGE